MGPDRGTKRSKEIMQVHIRIAMVAYGHLVLTGVDHVRRSFAIDPADSQQQQA